MYTIKNIPKNNLDIFSGTVSKKNRNITPYGNQIEAIAILEITSTKHRLYLSNEKHIASFGSIKIPYPAKLWSLEIHKKTAIFI